MPLNPILVQLWKNTGAWYLGHHTAFDMTDQELAARLSFLQMELLTEEDSDADTYDGKQSLVSPVSSIIEEVNIQPPTPLIELNGFSQLQNAKTSQGLLQPGKLRAFKRQLSQSLPSLTSSVAELSHHTVGQESLHERHNSYISFVEHKSLTIPQTNRRSTWLDGSDVTLQDTFRSRELGLPRSVARLVRQTPTRGSPVSSRYSIASSSDAADSEHSSQEEGIEDMSPAGSARNSLHGSSLDESENEQVPEGTLPQQLADAQERRKSFGKSKTNSLNKFVKKAEDLIKSFSSMTSTVPSREPSPGT